MQLGTPIRFDPGQVLALSEAATRLSPGRWSLEALRAGYPGAEASGITELPVGARDLHLMALRARLIGGALRAEPECEACGAIYELTLDPGDLGLGVGAVPPEAGFREVDIGGEAVELRPVTLADLLAIERIADAGEAAGALAKLVLGAEAGDPDADALGAALEALDPVADIWIGTQCPECGAAQSIPFDPVGFIARELRQKADALLDDIVTLAREFHWSEAEILALPEARRAFYVAEAMA